LNASEIETDGRLLDVAAGYGMRWKVEVLFSSIKRVFDESMQAESPEGCSLEVRIKMNCYSALVVMAS